MTVSAKHNKIAVVIVCRVVVDMVNYGFAWVIVHLGEAYLARVVVSRK